MRGLKSGLAGFLELLIVHMPISTIPSLSPLTEPANVLPGTRLTVGGKGLSHTQTQVFTGADGLLHVPLSSPCHMSHVSDPQGSSEPSGCPASLTSMERQIVAMPRNTFNFISVKDFFYS